jgi:hypothetical protein
LWSPLQRSKKGDHKGRPYILKLLLTD